MQNDEFLIIGENRIHKYKSSDDRSENKVFFLESFNDSVLLKNNRRQGYMFHIRGKIKFLLPQSKRNHPHFYQIPSDISLQP